MKYGKGLKNQATALALADNYSNSNTIKGNKYTNNQKELNFDRKQPAQFIPR
jgi:hypothetical protein